ncbi:hypothetical protein Sjap_010149 [Stephania japonica]|uniref:TF-B3 domain-containing protein n=1 Tax=Stephania japonica TaxID=461633 RepID=A0AAP0JB30_9MAGN
MRRPPLRSPATENHPHFFKIIHSGVIHEGRLCAIPHCILYDQSVNHSSEDVVLQLPDGRSWYVKVKCHKALNLRVNRGWKEFVLDNQLKEDDVCVFKAVEKEPDVI